MLLTTIWIGLAGALLMFAGDMLLYYTPEDFACDPKSSAEEKINAIIDVMKGLPARRVMAGGMIGPSAAFLYCVGFYHIVLMTCEQAHTLAMAARKIGDYDLLLFGRHAVDGDTAQTGPATAAQLGIPQITLASSIDVQDGYVICDRVLESFPLWLPSPVRSTPRAIQSPSTS